MSSRWERPDQVEVLAFDMDALMLALRTRGVDLSTSQLHDIMRAAIMLAGVAAERIADDEPDGRPSRAVATHCALGPGGRPCDWCLTRIGPG